MRPMSGPSFDPTVLLRSEQSGGRVSAIEVEVPARWPGPPLHRHDFDEAFYVLEGELTFQLRDELRSAEAEPPAWALADVPPVETVGPQIGAPG